MPVVRYTLAGAAAVSLLGGAAFAHHHRYHHARPEAAAQRAQVERDRLDRAQTGGGVETSAIVNGETVQVISSQPVPDTPENRSRFGQPLSHAGKMTQPIGD